MIIIKHLERDDEPSRQIGQSPQTIEIDYIPTTILVLHVRERNTILFLIFLGKGIPSCSLYYVSWSLMRPESMAPISLPCVYVCFWFNISPLIIVVHINWSGTKNEEASCFGVDGQDLAPTIFANPKML